MKKRDLSLFRIVCYSTKHNIREKKMKKNEFNNLFITDKKAANRKLETEKVFLRIQFTFSLHIYSRLNLSGCRIFHFEYGFTSEK